jgi:hypothetical protein
MSYICGVCKAHVGPGVKRRLHRTYRKVLHVDHRGMKGWRNEISSETPVCEGCDSALWAGQTLQERLRYFKGPVKLPYQEFRAKGERIYNGPPTSPKKIMEGLAKLTEMVVTHGRSSDDKKRPVMDVRPRCDVCGEVVVDGQVTAESTLCSKHLKTILQRKRRTK